MRRSFFNSCRQAFFLLSLTAIFSLQSGSTFAISQEGYTQTFDQTVFPYFAKVRRGTFMGKGNVPIAYRTFVGDKTKPAIVLLPGQGETLHKYAEFIYDLKKMGQTIYVVEHRGQGEAGKVENVGIQYVRDYHDYVEDLSTFIKLVVQPQAHPKLFLVAHSMGGAIGALYAAQNPTVFSAIVFSSPMFDMNPRPYSKRTALTLGRIMVKLGMGKFQGGKAKGELTSSAPRKEMTEKMQTKYSNIKADRISFSWAYNALSAINEVQKVKTSLNGVPMLMLQAAKDQQVPTAGQNEFCQALASCQKVIFPGAYHEVLMEVDPIRNSAMAQIEDFLQAHL
jgi:lysophospholipase